MRRIALVALGLLTATSATASAAAPARTVRLISGGTSSAQPASADGVSADGSRALFSTQEALLPADINGVSDVYARDSDGTLQLIGTGTSTAGSSFAGVSADGDRTWYTTTTPDLPSDGDAASIDIYERRRDGSLRQISLGNAVTDVSYVQASADGDHVVFLTTESIPGTGDSDGLADLFDRRNDGSVRLLTPATTASAITLSGGRNVMSADGSLVTFLTVQGLDASDLDAAQDSYSVPTAGGAYTLVTPDTPASATGIVNRAGTRTWFTTAASLVPADTDATSDIYERRADASIHLVSGGTAAVSPFLVTASDDGSNVVFSTTESLLPEDVDATTDIYERRGDGSLVLISSPADDAGASVQGLDRDGNVTFISTAALVPEDTNGISDFYLRRHDGGVVLLSALPHPALFAVYPTPNIPSENARTVFATNLVMDAADTNGAQDVYESTTDGARLLGITAAGTNFTFTHGSADSSRIQFTTTSTIPGTGDGDAATDVYEADFAVPDVTAAPGLAGTGKVGATHTCTAPAITGEGVTTTFAWVRDATAIAGATAATYKPVLADAGHNLKCRVTARNAIGADTADSAARGILPAARASKLAGFPITGTSLGCTTFAGATSTKYVWKRGTRTVKGRKARTYKVGAADLGKRLTCVAVGKKGTLATTATLRITVPKRCTVPNVRGLSPAAAKTKLGNAGCRSRTSKVTGSGVAKGLVLGTSPARGAKRPNGARITIRVRR